MIDAADQRARDFMTFCDGAGFPDLARRGRMVARDVLELAPMLDAERRARRAMQASYERAWRSSPTRPVATCLPDAFRARARAAIEAETA